MSTHARKAASRRPPATRSIGAIPGSTTRPRWSSELASHLRHLPRLPALLQSLPARFRPCSTPSTRPPTMELDVVDKRVYWQVVDHCYLCDMCYMTKCPYVPPHPWNVDFPHLMLRAKARRRHERRAQLARSDARADRRRRALAGIPFVAEVVNAANRSPCAPQAARESARRRRATRRCPNITRAARASVSGSNPARRGRAGAPRRDARSGRAVRHLLRQPQRAAIWQDLVAVFEHNGIAVALPARERCCGMPSSSSAISSRSRS